MLINYYMGFKCILNLTYALKYFILDIMLKYVEISKIKIYWIQIINENKNNKTKKIWIFCYIRRPIACFKG